MEVLQVFFSFGQGLGYLGFKSTIFLDFLSVLIPYSH